MEKIDLYLIEYIINEFLQIEDSISLIKTCRKLYLNLDKLIIKRGLEYCIKNNLSTKIFLFDNELDESALWIALKEENIVCAKEIHRLSHNYLDMNSIFEKILEHELEHELFNKNSQLNLRFIISYVLKHINYPIRFPTRKCYCNECDAILEKCVCIISFQMLKYALFNDVSYLKSALKYFFTNIPIYVLNNIHNYLLLLVSYSLKKYLLIQLIIYIFASTAPFITFKIIMHGLIYLFST